MKCESDEELEFIYQTKNKFYAYHKNSFLVLPDNKTIIGLDAKTKTTLIVEDINTNKAVSFGKHGSQILTLLYDKVTESLFAGDKEGHIKQYKRGKKTESFSLLKDYGNLGIREVHSSAQVGEFAIFGGYDFLIVAINIRERRIYQEKLRSPYWSTVSLQVCHGLNDKVYLSLGGSLRSSFSSVSDFQDVTEIYQMKSTDTNQNSGKVNEMLTIPKRKDQKINFHYKRKKELYSNLPEENPQTKGDHNKKDLPKTITTIIDKNDLQQSESNRFSNGSEHIKQNEICEIGRDSLLGKREEQSSKNNFEEVTRRLKQIKPNKSILEGTL